MNVRAKIERLLEATATATALKVRVDTLRAELHTEALARWRDDGAAPTWSARGLGKVRLDGADAERRPHVADPDAYASWVAQRRPDVVTALVKVPVGALEEVLDALRFAGVDGATATLEVDPAWSAELLDGLTVDVTGTFPEEAVTVTNVDTTTGEADVVPGVGAHPAPAPRIVVNLDGDRKRQAVEEAVAALAVEDADDEVTAEDVAEELTATATATAREDAARLLTAALGARGVVDVPAPILEAEDTTPTPAQLEATDAGLTDVTIVDAAVDVLDGATPSPATVNAARRTLVKLLDSETAWTSSKAAELHRLAQAADLGLTKGKLGKPALRDAVTAGLITVGALPSIRALPTVEGDA